jgi:hypothetical protein
MSVLWSLLGGHSIPLLDFCGMQMASSIEGNMLNQFIVGGGAIVFTIALHAVVMTKVVLLFEHLSKKNTKRPSLFLIGVMVPTVAALMLAHVVEVIIWALVYLIVDATPANADHLYFAFVNYTTLGYGDIIPVKQWQLLGPMTAMDGIVLFGWSTAVIIAILRWAMERVYPSLGEK